MERLTYWNKEMECWSYHGPSGEVAIRLAAYEDTGLEPEEVTELMAAHGTAILELSEYRSIGPAKHFLELAQAEKDGQLVVLPCKPDASAYQWKKGDDIPNLFRFDGVTISEDGEVTYQTHWGETFKPDDFGKTVFLTREEAEAALKKREEADNEAD